MSFELRYFNHSFEKGELVKLADDIPDGSEHGLMEQGNFLKKVDVSILKNKVGVVKSCDSDLHSFSQGSFYSVVVDFDFVCVEAIAAYFLSLTEQELKKFIAKKRFKKL